MLNFLCNIQIIKQSFFFFFWGKDQEKNQLENFVKCVGTIFLSGTLWSKPNLGWASHMPAWAKQLVASSNPYVNEKKRKRKKKIRGSIYLPTSFNSLSIQTQTTHREKVKQWQHRQCVLETLPLPLYVSAEQEHQF